MKNPTVALAGMAPLVWFSWMWFLVWGVGAGPTVYTPLAEGFLASLLVWCVAFLRWSRSPPVNSDPLFQ